MKRSLHTRSPRAACALAGFPSAQGAQLSAAEFESLNRLGQELDAAVELHDTRRQGALQAALGRFAAHAELGALLNHGEPSGVSENHLDSSAARANQLEPSVTRSGSSPRAATYRRHLLLADPQGRYSAVAIVWDRDQYSPVHGHHTWCAYSVLRGALAESSFGWCEATRIAQLHATGIRRPGEVSYTDAGRGGIHRLGNPYRQPALSVHVYGVPGEYVATSVNDLVAADV